MQGNYASMRPGLLSIGHFSPEMHALSEAASMSQVKSKRNRREGCYHRC